MFYLLMRGNGYFCLYTQTGKRMCCFWFQWLFQSNSIIFKFRTNTTIFFEGKNSSCSKKMIKKNGKVSVIPTDATIFLSISLCVQTCILSDFTKIFNSFIFHKSFDTENSILHSRYYIFMAFSFDFFLFHFSFFFFFVELHYPNEIALNR